MERERGGVKNTRKNVECPLMQSMQNSWKNTAKVEFWLEKSTLLEKKISSIPHIVFILRGWSSK